MKKTVPFTKAKIETIIKEHPTPFHIYDEKAIRKNAKKLLKTFSWNKGFKEYFAVKALPNPHILQIMKSEDFGADCSSLAELIMAEKVGLRGEEIMFTSNATAAKEYKKAKELGAIINLDDISHIDFLEQHAGMPELLCFRYNPGKRRKGGFFIGKPEEAKFGLTREQIFKAYALAKEKGVKRFGLHTMIASNELDEKYFIETAEMLFTLVKELQKKLNITFEFINIGGGIGIPYRPEDNIFDLAKLSKGIEKLYKKLEMKPLKIFMENGRMISGPYGYLVTRVIHTKDIYKNYLCVDSCMANLIDLACMVLIIMLRFWGKKKIIKHILMILPVHFAKITTVLQWIGNCQKPMLATLLLFTILVHMVIRWDLIITVNCVLLNYCCKKAEK